MKSATTNKSKRIHVLSHMKQSIPIYDVISFGSHVSHPSLSWRCQLQTTGKTGRDSQALDLHLELFVCVFI